MNEVNSTSDPKSMNEVSSTTSNVEESKVKDPIIEAASKAQDENMLSLIVTIGPVGFGKSSWASHLASKYGFVHVDGDKVAASIEDTLKTGQERQFLTFSKINEAFLRGCTPIYSGGGGVLFDFRGNFCYGNSFARAFPDHILKIVLILTSNCDTFHLSSYDEMQKASGVYQDPTSAKITIEAVERRLREKIWSLPLDKQGRIVSEKNFKNQIVNLSRKNRRFALQLIDIASIHYLAPIVTRKDYDKGEFLPLNVVDNLPDLSNTLFPTQISVQQERLLLFDHNKGKHITLSYWKDGKKITREEYFGYMNLCEKKMQKIYSCRRINLLPSQIGKCNGKGISLLVVNGIIKKSHVTLNSGVHQPVLMGDVTIALRNGDETISLPHKSIPGKFVEYKLPDLDSITMEEIETKGHFFCS